MDANRLKRKIMKHRHLYANRGNNHPTESHKVTPRLEGFSKDISAILGFRMPIREAIHAIQDNDYLHLTPYVNKTDNPLGVWMTLSNNLPTLSAKYNLRY